jgi:hypothetical protein
LPPSTEDGKTIRITGVADDHGDGGYHFIYVATKSAEYVLDVRLVAELYPEPGEFIVDSPWFKVKIVPAPASAPHCETTGDNLVRAFAGYPSFFWIKAFDKYRNRLHTGGDDFKAELEGPETITPNVVDIGTGEYTIYYQADMSGAYNLSVTLHKRATEIHHVRCALTHSTHPNSARQSCG